MALLAAYNFDEASGNALDRSGNGRDITLNAGAQRDPSGHTNAGLTKLGAGISTIAAPAFGQTTNRTFMFWLKGQGNAVWWIRWYVTADDTGAWGLYLLSGNLTLRLRKGGSNTNTSVPWTDDGAWHHYAATYDGTNARLYKDGTLVATSAAVLAPLDTANEIQMLETSLTTQTVDDLRIYDEALTQPQIASLMATPVPDGSASVVGTLNLAASAGLTAGGTAHRRGTLNLGAVANVSATVATHRSGLSVLTATASTALLGASKRAGTLGLLSSVSLGASGSTRRSGTLTLHASAGLTAARAGIQRDAVWATSCGEQTFYSSSVGIRRWEATCEEQR